MVTQRVTIVVFCFFPNIDTVAKQKSSPNIPDTPKGVSGMLGMFGNPLIDTSYTSLTPL